eukprot:Tbor_TRINITY_DN6003_c0_g2::TRINITY_DN6003_c0_g2_i2::g.11603::m.11603
MKLNRYAHFSSLSVLVACLVHSALAALGVEDIGNPLKESTDGTANVYQVGSGDTTDTTCSLKNSATVIALYRLVLGDFTGVTVKGHAPIPATATYTHFNNKGDTDENTIPTFVTDSTRKLEVMKFDGTGQLIENGPKEAKGSAGISIAVWVNYEKPEKVQWNTIIVSKSKSKSKSLSRRTINCAWALLIEVGKFYCLQVGSLKTCTEDAVVRVGVAQYVTATYFDTHFEIFVDGKKLPLAKSTGDTETSVPDSEFPLTIGGSFQDSPSSVPDTNFKGELQDLRVYGNKLELVDVDYLYSCSIGKTKTNKQNNLKTEVKTIIKGGSTAIPFADKTKNPITISFSVAKGDNSIGWTGKSALKRDGGPTSGNSRKTASTVIGVVSAIVFIVILVGVVILYRKYRSDKSVSRDEDFDMEISAPLASSTYKQASIPINKINESHQSPKLTPRYID